jgi:hypothetical protein
VQRALLVIAGLPRRLWRALREAVAGRPVVSDQYMDELFAHFPFRASAQSWFRRHVSLEIKDPASLTGGGLFFSGQNRVLLNSAQYEAAIHELAHAWWDSRRHAKRDALIAAVVRAATEDDLRFARIARLAGEYVHGSADGHFPGFLRDRNDAEMYAGLASGCMADTRLLPPYLRVFYGELFDRLPDGRPAPVSAAPHA